MDSNRAKSFLLFTHNEEHHVLQQNMRGGIFMSHKKTWSIKTRNAGLSNYVKCTWHDSCLSLNWTFRKQDLEWFFENKYFLHTNSNWSFSYLTMKKPRNGYESLRTWVYITGLLHEWSVSQLSALALELGATFESLYERFHVHLLKFPFVYMKLVRVPFILRG